jgi:predicted ATPase
MKPEAHYIQSVDIHNLWRRYSVHWELLPDVNILSGMNGIGKSTIIECIAYTLNAAAPPAGMPEVQVHFDVPDAVTLPHDFIAPPVYLSEQTQLLGTLLRRYAEAPLSADAKLRFQELIDSLFGMTGKTIDRDASALLFHQDGETLPPAKLSSGEKQMLIILLTVLLRSGTPSVLLMDEPETSLHIEWQQKLIEMIRHLNSSVQLILTTHSPAVIMDGWLDAVTEVSDIMKPMT